MRAGVWEPAGGGWVALALAEEVLVLGGSVLSGSSAQLSSVKAASIHTQHSSCPSNSGGGLPAALPQHSCVVHLDTHLAMTTAEAPLEAKDFAKHCRKVSSVVVCAERAGSDLGTDCGCRSELRLQLAGKELPSKRCARDQAGADDLSETALVVCLRRRGD